MSLFLNSARFQPPLPRGYVVPRPDLTKVIEGRQRHLLTLTLAPAGYGKTNLLAHRCRDLAAQGQTVAWVSLEENDQTAQVFLSSLAAGVAAARAGADSLTPESLNQLASTSQDMMVSGLLHDIRQVKSDITLFLDDFHRAETAETNDILEQLLHSAPSNFCLVVASRTVPNLNIASLKVRDQVIEVRTGDLRFSIDEAREFLKAGYGLTLDEEQLSAIHRYTDGWAIGLQVAAIVSAKSGTADQFIENFKSGNTDVMDFLAHDVIGDLSQSAKDFLRDTADLDLLVPELCDEVTESTGSKAKLEELVRLNLFLQPVDEEAGWYRYHHLFSDFLKQHFQTDPDTAKHRHERAHGWFLAHGLNEHAVRHGIHAELWEETADALEDIWRSFLSFYRVGQLGSWINALPAETLAKRAELRIALGWILLLRRQVSKANEVLATIDVPDVRSSTPLILPKDPFELEAFLLECAILYVADDAEAIAYLSDIDLSGLEHLSPFHQGILLDVVIYAQIFSGSLDRASRLAEFASELQTQSQNYLGAIYAEVLKGVGENISGDLDAARETFTSISLLAAMHFKSDFPMPHAFIAEIEYERNLLTQTEASLALAQGSETGSSVIDAVIAYYLTKARYARARDGATAALSVLAQAEVVGHQEGHRRLLVHALAERVNCLASMGRLAQAADAVEDLDRITINDTPISHRIWPRSRSHFVRAKALLLTLEGDIEQARSLLTPYLVEAEASGRTGALIKFLLLDVRALHQAGKDDRATRQLAKAISRAAPGRYLRVFLDQLWGCEALVRDTLRRIAHGRAGNLPPIDDAYLAELGTLFSVALEFAQAEEVVEPIEDLTRRERTLLLALAAGKTNKQIAAENGITPNTVAWHLKNLFAKLNVKNRTAAAKAAQFFDLSR